MGLGLPERERELEQTASCQEDSAKTCVVCDERVAGGDAGCNQRPVNSAAWRKICGSSFYIANIVRFTLQTASHATPQLSQTGLKEPFSRAAPCEGMDLSVFIY